MMPGGYEGTATFSGVCQWCGHPGCPSACTTVVCTRCVITVYPYFTNAIEPQFKAPRNRHERRKSPKTKSLPWYRKQHG